MMKGTEMETCLFIRHVIFAEYQVKLRGLDMAWVQAQLETRR